MPGNLENLNQSSIPPLLISLQLEKISHRRAELFPQKIDFNQKDLLGIIDVNHAYSQCAGAINFNGETRTALITINNYLSNGISNDRDIENANKIASENRDIAFTLYSHGIGAKYLGDIHFENGRKGFAQEFIDGISIEDPESKKYINNNTIEDFSYIQEVFNKYGNELPGIPNIHITTEGRLFVVGLDNSKPEYSLRRNSNQSNFLKQLDSSIKKHFKNSNSLPSKAKNFLNNIISSRSKASVQIPFLELMENTSNLVKLKEELSYIPTQLEPEEQEDGSILIQIDDGIGNFTPCKFRIENAHSPFLIDSNNDTAISQINIQNGIIKIGASDYQSKQLFWLPDRYLQEEKWMLESKSLFYSVLEKSNLLYKDLSDVQLYFLFSAVESFYERCSEFEKIAEQLDSIYFGPDEEDINMLINDLSNHLLNNIDVKSSITFRGSNNSWIYKKHNFSNSKIIFKNQEDRSIDVDLSNFSFGFIYNHKSENHLKSNTIYRGINRLFQLQHSPALRNLASTSNEKELGEIRDKFAEFIENSKNTKINDYQTEESYYSILKYIQQISKHNTSLIRSLSEDFRVQSSLGSTTRVPFLKRLIALHMSINSGAESASPFVATSESPKIAKQFSNNSPYGGVIAINSEPKFCVDFDSTLNDTKMLINGGGEDEIGILGYIPKAEISAWIPTKESQTNEFFNKHIVRLKILSLFRNHEINLSSQYEQVLQQFDIDEEIFTSNAIYSAFNWLQEISKKNNNFHKLNSD